MHTIKQVAANFIVIATIFITGYGVGKINDSNVRAETNEMLSIKKRTDSIEADLKRYVAIKELAYNLQQQNKKLSKFKAEYIANIIIYSSISQGVDYKLIASTATIESRFNENAISHKGARGIMQIMPNTAIIFGFDKDRLFDVEYNILVGTTILGTLVDKYGEYPAIRAYLCGESNKINCWYRDDTNEYLKKIIDVKREM